MTRTLCRMLITLMIWAPSHLALAGMIPTVPVAATASQADRAAVLNALDRTDVAGQLQALGVEAAVARDRVAAMADEDVSTLASQINSLPAGGSTGAAVVGIIIIVLIVWWLATMK